MILLPVPSLVIKLTLLIVPGVAEASALDGQWKVIDYQCKSARFKAEAAFEKQQFASFGFDTESGSATMSFEALKCIFSGELDLKIDGRLLKFSNYRTVNHRCGEIDSARDFHLAYEIQAGPPERLLLKDENDESCEDEKGSVMVLERFHQI